MYFGSLNVALTVKSPDAIASVFQQLVKGRVVAGRVFPSATSRAASRVMPALSSAASTLPFQPGILIPPSVTAREPSTVGLPGPPTNCFLARNSATSKARKTLAEPIRILDFLFIVGPQGEFGVVTVGRDLSVTGGSLPF